MYAGPLGWISGDKSEFVVAIRSSLLSQNEEEVVSSYLQSVSGLDVFNFSLKLQLWNLKGTCLNLYAGVGIVKGAKSVSEWRELDLKIKQVQYPLTLIDMLAMFICLLIYFF